MSVKEPKVQSSDSGYRFHSNCGDNVNFISGKKSALRSDSTTTVSDGVVLTQQPLKNKVRLEVRLDSKVEKWPGNLEIGFTTNLPEKLNFPGTMSICTEGITWMWSGDRLLENGKTVAQLGVDLDECKVGDTCGIEKRDDSVHFYFNDKHLDTTVSLPSRTVYGVVDIYGQAERVTLCDSGMVFPAEKPRCSYKDLCGRFKKSLKLSADYFDTEHDICYCKRCHEYRGDRPYYSRGDPPKDYGIPIGWCRFGLKVPPKATAQSVFDDWHVAFHGTKKNAVESILKSGELCMPGDVVVGGRELRPISGHFTSITAPEGFDTRQVFLSPSIKYSGCEVYAKSSDFRDELTTKSHKVKVVFQVAINPKSYKVGPQTIGAKKKIDPKFNNQEIEWFTKERGSVIMYGLLVKIE